MVAVASQITSLTIVYPNRLFRRRAKKTSKLRVTGLCAGNSPVTGEFPAFMASNVENVSIWWRHHAIIPLLDTICPYNFAHATCKKKYTDQFVRMGMEISFKFD